MPSPKGRHLCWRSATPAPGSILMEHRRADLGRAEIHAVVALLHLDEDVGVEQGAHQTGSPSRSPNLPERGRFPDAEELKGVTVESLTFERAGDEGSGEAAAEPDGLCEVEVALRQGGDAG